MHRHHDMSVREVRAHQHRDVTSTNGGPEVHQFWHCWNPVHSRSLTSMHDSHERINFVQI